MEQYKSHQPEKWCAVFGPVDGPCIKTERDPFLCKNIAQLRIFIWSITLSEKCIPLFGAMDHLKGQIAQLDAKISAEIERDAEQTQQVKRLRSVPGIGPHDCGRAAGVYP